MALKSASSAGRRKSAATNGGAANGATANSANGVADHGDAVNGAASNGAASNGANGNAGASYSSAQLQPLLDALLAAQTGDFSVRLPAPRNGVLSDIHRAFNDMIRTNESMTKEITRVGKSVGREGKMTERAELKGAEGSWAAKLDSINELIQNIASPTNEIARVITAVARGDLSQKMALEIDGTPVKGEFLRIRTTVNTMVDQLSSFSAEVTRVAREVGTEGKLGGQAEVKGVSGTWKDLTENVNFMASNLTTQVRGIAKVVTAVANGDLQQKLVVEAKGEVAALAETINGMTDTLGIFAEQVTTVAREVGTEGKLGGQANVPNVAGTWKDLTDNVNSLAGNLTNQVRNIALVTTAVAKGDLSQKITVNARGEILELKDTINVMVDQLNSFSAEVTRVAREVGTEGKLGGQAEVKGISGTWKDLTDNVNFMAGNLTDQVRNIALVTTAVANGDLSQKITVNARGEILELKDTINVMVDQLNSFSAEVTRVAREVGTEGKLGGQAEVKGVSGTWKDLTENVNFMASNLTTQVRGIVKVVTAVADGDLSQKLVVEAKGEVAALADTINSMTETLSIFAEQVTTVAREVGTEGILGGQANVPNVAGTWKDLTENVNFMASNLTTQVRGIAKVVTAVANGDLKQKLVVEAKGEVAALAETINGMTDTLGIFAEQVTTVAREVGTEGKLGGQANVPNVAGTWKDLTDNVNYMAGNLTVQLRDVSKVATAIANGDLTQKITVDVKGEILQIKDVINQMVDRLGSFAAEVTRVAREVGTEGKLGGQAEVQGVAGTWKDLTDNVNFMADNLTDQVRNIALVTTAVANGDLSQKITVNARGEILELKDTINVMVDQLNSFAAEVTRVAREVGTEGKLGGQAEVKGVSGTWKDLTENVNFMASNLTTQVRGIAKVVTAVANGDLKQKLVVEAKGEVAALAETINGMTDTLGIFAEQVTTVAREVGTEGILGGQAKVPNVAGTWKDLTENVNFMASNLTTQVRGIAKVVTAVASGDLSQKLVVEAKGEVAALTETINGMTDTLGIFAEQVTTVAREVGTEGILGGQAKVPNVAGTWKDLTENVNSMANNLTDQVRNIALVTTAVANGDLSQKITVNARGEILELKDTINVMVDQLNSFAAEVTRVAREVGTEGKLGGQAEVKGVSGTWKDLTENVNFMANSLTVQVRAISDVATSVTEGDLTRSITVEAQGEVSSLKNNINQMIANLKETTQLNNEQDWLKTNLARFSRLMQGQKNLEDVAGLIMSELTPLVSAHHGAFYMNETENGAPVLKLLSSYAYRERKNVANRFHLGEGLVGQCALEKKSIVLTNVPGDYIQISSGLGEAPPLNIIVLPVLFEGEIMAVIELASFQAFSAIHATFLDQLMESFGVVLNMISANMRTEELLEQSQSLTQELQSQSQELQSQQNQLKSSNAELEMQAKELEERSSLLAEQNTKVELKNREVELGRAALEEKAEQLALSSKYKSEFLANMSHELRTPLNSMLILAKLLADNSEKNLSNKQVEFASTIYSSGGDLLNLINEILDLSKVESGKMEIDVAEVPLVEVQDYIERNFRQVAEQKKLEFEINLAPDTPQSIYTDTGRLQQVLKNLLSNAFKFTEKGRVSLDVYLADPDPRLHRGSLANADKIIAFSVSDTGIGIAKSKQNLIFEAFQQADGTTSRKYGGTGLGLSISREITRLLGGQITIESESGKGSTFTLYLPQSYVEIDGDGDKLSSLGEFGDDDGGWSPLGIVTEEMHPDGERNVGRRNAQGRREGARNGHSNGSSSSTQAKSTPEFGRTFGAGSSTSVAPLPAIPMSRRHMVTEAVEDDSAEIVEGDRVLLVIEDDVAFARILRDMAHARGFKCLVATQGDTGLALAREHQPNAITLDLQLPTVDGWTILDQLKRDPATRHIPVQVISVVDRDRASTIGAIAYLEKPVEAEALEGAFNHITSFLDRDVKTLLLVEDDEAQRRGMIELIGNGDVKVTAVESAEEAIATMEQTSFDCVVLDLGLPGMSGFDLLKRIKQSAGRDVPVIIHTSRDLSKREEAQLKKYAETVITKDLRAPEKLLDDTALFLHRVMDNQSEARRQTIISRGVNDQAEATADTKIGAKPASKRKAKKTDEAAKPDNAAPMSLQGHKVLIVDDDVRNIFALTSVLENHGLDVLFAENGRSAIEVLKSTPDLDLILMDIMMPEMDGYQTTRAIRQLPGHESLPIIALTAKAMEGDREKCLQAGASDYIPKPVDTDVLLDAIRRWLSASA